MLEGVGELVAVGDAEFGEGGVEVAFDGSYGDGEVVGDLGVGFPVGRECRDLAFASAERDWATVRLSGSVWRAFALLGERRDRRAASADLAGRPSR